MHHAAKENTICERFLGAVRRACLDHLLILSAQHVRRIVPSYVACCNDGRSQQGLQ